MRPSDQSSGVNLPSQPGPDIDDRSDLTTEDLLTAAPASKRTELDGRSFAVPPGSKDSPSTLGEKSRLSLSSSTQSINRNVSIPHSLQEPKTSTTVAPSNINPSTWSPTVSSESKPTQTVELLKEVSSFSLLSQFQACKSG